LDIYKLAASVRRMGAVSFLTAIIVNLAFRIWCVNWSVSLTSVSTYH